MITEGRDIQMSVGRDMFLGAFVAPWMTFACCRRLIVPRLSDSILMKKAEKKNEDRFDIANLRAHSREVKELHYLLLDDPYLRKLLRLARWRRVDLSHGTFDSEVSSGEEINYERLKMEKASNEEMY